MAIVNNHEGLVETIDKQMNETRLATLRMGGTGNLDRFITGDLFCCFEMTNAVTSISPS